jgi:hypothetical protein
VLSLFRMPWDVGDQALIGAAHGILEKATATKDLFVTYEMSPNFLEELQAAIQRLETAISGHKDNNAIRSTTADSFEETMATAMDAVYRLAGVMPNKLKKDSAEFREWEDARRVVRGRAPKPSGPEPSPPAATESSVTK